MSAILQYPQTVLGPIAEEIEGTAMPGGLVLLTQHASFMPLAPGDLVSVDGDRVIVAIERLEKQWMAEVAFHLPAGTTFGRAPSPDHPALRAVAETVAEWRKGACVTQTTSFTVLVSCSTREWIERNVVGHPYVEDCELVRTPDTVIDLQRALANPTLT